MKSSLRILATIVLFSSLESMARVSDGCYVTSQPGALGPVVCISGMNEEGLNGSGVRVATLSAGRISWCGKTLSTSIKTESSNLANIVFQFNPSSSHGMKSIHFRAWPGPEGLSSGNVTFVEQSGPTKLSFQQLKAADAKRLGDISDSEACLTARGP